MILGVAILLSIAASAQTFFGIKAGMNASEFHYPDQDYMTKIGFHAGGLAHIHINENWGVQPEVMYSLEGAKIEAEPDDVRYNLHMINVPILAQYMFDNGFRIEAGPQVGFLISAKLKDANGEAQDLDEGYNTVTFSIPVGVGYLLSTGFGFDARYNFGISNLADNDGSEKLTGNNFQFGVFYQFNNGK